MLYCLCVPIRLTQLWIYISAYLSCSPLQSHCHWPHTHFHVSPILCNAYCMCCVFISVMYCYLFITEEFPLILLFIMGFSILCVCWTWREELLLCLDWRWRIVCMYYVFYLFIILLCFCYYLFMFLFIYSFFVASKDELPQCGQIKITRLLYFTHSRGSLQDSPCCQWNITESSRLLHRCGPAVRQTWATSQTAVTVNCIWALHQTWPYKGECDKNRQSFSSVKVV